MIIYKKGEEVYDVPKVEKFDYFKWVELPEGQGGPRRRTKDEIKKWAEGRIPIAGSLKIAVPQAHTMEGMTEKLESTIS